MVEAVLVGVAEETVSDGGVILAEVGGAEGRVTTVGGVESRVI